MFCCQRCFFCAESKAVTVKFSADLENGVFRAAERLKIESPAMSGADSDAARNIFHDENNAQ